MNRRTKGGDWYYRECVLGLIAIRADITNCEFLRNVLPC
jgi:hypothetical protein